MDHFPIGRVPADEQEFLRDDISHEDFVLS
jgi:hypothetical protein